MKHSTFHRSLNGGFGQSYSRWLWLSLLALVYLAAGKFGLMLALVNPSVSAVWPPTGIALAVFLLAGNQAWPGILLGAFLVSLMTTGSLPASGLIAIGNTLEGLTGAYLVNRFAGGRRAFDRVQNIFKFAILAGLLSTSISATLGTASLVLNRLASWPDIPSIWWTWLLGDASGALVVAPVLLLWALNPQIHWKNGRILEGCLLLTVLTLLGLAIFGGFTPYSVQDYPLEFILLPVVVWAALRFGQREAATATLFLSALAIWGTLHGYGPFARMSPNAALILLQTYMGMAAMMGLGLAAAVEESRKTDDAARVVNENLRQGLNELEQRNVAMAVLNEMGSLLQSCLAVEEAYSVIRQSMPHLFPNESGALYMTNPERDRVEAAVVWGQPPPPQQSFAPRDCWALRRGRTHLSTAEPQDLRCIHLAEPMPASSLCLPMIAQGEILGVLHLESMTVERFSASMQQFSQTVTDGIALAIANLRLRETLRQQSIRDQLTGLFNRRYLEESLDQELRRASRNESRIGLILLDLDHFKVFNDTFGHATGDLLLQELGAFLKDHIRGGDLACRYGGEEFLLILPEASLEATRQRAEEVLEGIRSLQIHDPPGRMDPITLSIGVAVFPEHGSSREALIRAADMALYRAKQEGRNQIAVAEAA